jgi:hypothetical protein
VTLRLLHLPHNDGRFQGMLEGRSENISAENEQQVQRSLDQLREMYRQTARKQIEKLEELSIPESKSNFSLLQEAIRSLW